MVQTGLIGDQFSSELCHFSTTITLFYQVIHHNDNFKPKMLSSFTLVAAHVVFLSAAVGAESSKLAVMVNTGRPAFLVVWLHTHTVTVCGSQAVD